MDEILLIFYLWPARSRARAVALAEALSLLRDLHARASEKGPLSEQGGLFWILLPAENLEAARVRLARSGYTAAVDWLEPVSEPVGHKKRVRGAAKDALQWHHRWYRRHRLFEEDPEVVREGALFLDPFAGVGGLIIEALASNYEVVSADWDPVVQHGLAHLGARHLVAYHFLMKPLMQLRLNLHITRKPLPSWLRRLMSCIEY